MNTVRCVHALITTHSLKQINTMLSKLLLGSYVRGIVMQNYTRIAFADLSASSSSRILRSVYQL